MYAVAAVRPTMAAVSRAPAARLRANWVIARDLRNCVLDAASASVELLLMPSLRSRPRPRGIGQTVRSRGDMRAAGGGPNDVVADRPMRRWGRRARDGVSSRRP